MSLILPDEINPDQPHPADARELERYSPRAKRRGAIEHAIVRALLFALVREGYTIVTDDGGDEKRDTDVNGHMLHIFGVDEAMIHIKMPEQKWSTIWLVFGNDGWDVIHDYNQSITPLMEAFHGWVENQQARDEARLAMAEDKGD